MTILVTGAAGFIGFHTAQALLDRGEPVIGLDNLNAYYDVTLKQHRLDRLTDRKGFHFAKVDLADREAVAGLFDRHKRIETIKVRQELLAQEYKRLGASLDAASFDLAQRFVRTTDDLGADVEDSNSLADGTKD